jgi:hypothetical protein
MNDPGQTRTIVNDRIRRNTTIYMIQYYDRISPCRIRRNTAINGEENGRLRPYTESVNLDLGSHQSHLYVGRSIDAFQKTSST